MIRRGTRSDMRAIAQLIADEIMESTYNKHVDTVDLEHIQKLVYSVLQVGYVWVYEVEGKLVGMLAAIKEANVWVPDRITLKEAAWFVKPEHRGSVGAGKLFIKFCQEGDRLLANGEIVGYFTTRMSSTQDYDLESRGFRQVEKLYIKD